MTQGKNWKFVEDANFVIVSKNATGDAAIAKFIASDGSVAATIASTGISSVAAPITATTVAATSAAGTALSGTSTTGVAIEMAGAAAFLEGVEIADPAAPAANKGRLYFKDNGSGKTLLVVRFPTGAVQTIATEP